jgi:apolipoprotein N-acyltransferase
VTSRWDSYTQQMQRHLDGTRILRQDSVDLVLWSETAIPFPVGASNYSSLWQRLNSSLDSIGVPVFSGMAYVQYYDSASAPVTAHRIDGSQQYYDYYNAAALLGSRDLSGRIHKKIKLVPFAERIPYAETFRFLIEPLKWSVGISGWGLGKDTVVFEVRSRNGNVIRFAGMICYESVYPDFVREYVRRGAEFLVVVTNDSWWGNTSGAYQHMAFNAFRAVENRRYVVQCANGGISGYCDPVGNIQKATTLYSALQYSVRIEPRNETTFYTRHGDIFGVCCTWIAGCFVLLGLSRTIHWKELKYGHKVH